MIRTIFAVGCLVGLVLGGAFAPAAGISTPVPDLGVDPQGDPDVGGGLGSSGGGGSAGVPPEPGAEQYGGVSGGGYPESNTVGGELELSDHEELLVRSPRPSRWRLGAYGTYTGEGWDRREDREPLYVDDLPTATGEQPRERYTVRVTTKREFEALATAWRPAAAEVSGQKVYVDGNRGFTVREPLGPGRHYSTVSYGPPSTEAAAAVESWSYPPRFERYTELPADTPDRLGEKTDEITADAETPYEAARAVELWLEANKEYSLDADHDRDRDVATQFVFEMEAGYCQYFATSMAAMLRTQDIPARYVTGYGPGERVGEDRYLVRGSDAHAWVEVYVDGVGWVPFDPTPPDGRQQAGRDGETARELEDVAVAETDDGADRGRETPQPTDEPDDGEDDATGSVNVALNPDPVPGREVTATVTRGGEPVVGATVLFNGDPIGKTDAAGNVTGEVPYNRSLEISVRTNDGSPRLAGVGTGRRYASVQRPALAAAEDTTVRFEVPTEIDIEVRGDPVAGGVVEVVATIDGEPVRDGEVRVDGRAVARTDADGRASVPLPDAETAELVVERGEATGERTLNLTTDTSGGDEREDGESDGADRELNVSVSSSLPFALPGSTAEVTVTDASGQPVSDARVSVGGRAVGRTGPDGTLETRLPFSLSGSTTVTAWLGGGGGSGDGGGAAGGRGGGGGAAGSMGAPTSPSDAAATGAATVDDLNRNLGAVAGVLALLVGGLLALAYRRGLTPRVLAALVRRAAVGAVRYVVAGLVGLAGVVDEGLARLRAWARRAVDLLGRGLEGAAELAESVRVGAVSAGRRVAAAVRDLPRRLHPRTLLAWLAGLRASATASVAAARAEALGVEDADAGADDAVPTVREAWGEFRSYVTVRSWDTSTPGEIARWGVTRDGLPDDAVATLRDAFREVEYGARSPEDRAPLAREALDRIRESQREEGGEEP